MQTSLHILSLVAELKREIVGGEVVSTEFYKKERTAYLFVKVQKSTLALGFSYHPAGPGCFLVPASKLQLDTREKPWPVFDIVGATVTGVEQLGFDRVFELTLEKNGKQFPVVFEALGPNGNIWLLSGDRFRQATLRKRQIDPKVPYAPSPLPERLNPLDLTDEQLKTKWQDSPDLPAAALVEKKILGFNRTLAREVVARAGIEFGSSHAEVNSLLSAVVWTVARFKSVDMGYLHEVANTVEAYPFKLSSVAEPPQKYKTLSLAVMAVTRLRRSGLEAVDEEKQLIEAVKRALKRLERRCAKIETDLEKAEDFEAHKKVALLLQISFDRIGKGMASITVEDIYHDPPDEVSIALDPAFSAQQNVEAYFKKYRKGRDGHELLRRRLEISRAETVQCRTMLSELEIDFAAASQRYEAELAAVRPSSRPAGSEPAVRMPYRVHTLSSGLRIFIGRDGTDNDRTTFEFARPYELWFHAQQCPGSHVVIKFPNKSFQPSKSEIEETAAIAAYHSRARKNSLVPVIYTERKYVRKPRKAKPGLVTVEREKSVMVAPLKPE